MPRHTRALTIALLALPVAAGCAGPAGDQRVSQTPPPAVVAPGALVGPPTGWRTLSEGQTPVPIPGHPPITTSGVVSSFDAGTGILSFEDGRMVKLTDQSTAGPGGAVVRPGDRIVVQNVLPVGVRSGPKTLVDRAHRMGTVASVDEPNAVVRLTDGTTLRVASTTNIHSGVAGSSMLLTDLRPGDEVVVVLVDEAAAAPPVASAAPPAPGTNVTTSPSALPRQAGSAPPEAAEVMVFRLRAPAR
jgi:hypothetical protein